MDFFLKGMIVGFSIAAPVGPIGILCIRRTVQFGRWSGLFSGLGAALADAVYAIIAAFGLTLISHLLIAGQGWIRGVGGLFLLYLGWKTFFAKISDNTKKVSHKTFLSDFISTFFLTITNPMTILSYIGVFAGIGLSSLQGSYAESASLVIGVFIGALLWWLILSEGVTLFRKKITKPIMVWINRIAGILIAVFGVIALLTLVI